MHSANWALIIVLHLLSGVVAISGQHQALKPYVGTNNNVDLYVNSTTAGRVLVNGQDIVSLCAALRHYIAFFSNAVHGELAPDQPTLPPRDHAHVWGDGAGERRPCLPCNLVSMHIGLPQP